VAVDFLFQGVENSYPRIRNYGRTGERHFFLEFQPAGIKKIPGKKTNDGSYL
jgi:hypothetical protein